MSARYAHLARLGSGGMADVDLALDTVTGQRVVVKRLLEHLQDEDELVARFAAEARLATQLVHPNIVRSLEAGEDPPGVPYIVMEWLDGLDVRALLIEASARGERLAPAVACAIAADVARGLQYAHARADAAGRPLGVVHRDVSPHNVFVTRAGVAKVLDFGIARSALQVGLSRAGTTHGKLGYMAPEQLAGLAVDARADLFALGVTLWEMLAMRRLWPGGSGTDTARAIRGGAAAPPSTLVPGGVPNALDGVVMALLAKLPASRPASGAVVAGWLDGIARSLAEGGDPVRDVAAAIARLAPGPGQPRAAGVGGPWDDASTERGTVG